MIPKQLFYTIVPTSIAVILFLWWNYLYQDYLKRNSRKALEVTYWQPSNQFDIPHPMIYVSRCSMKITLDGSSNDKASLEFARRAVKELIHGKGITRGIEFTITDNAKYASLVALFDICLREEARYYVNYHDKFLVFNRSPAGGR